MNNDYDRTSAAGGIKNWSLLRHIATWSPIAIALIFGIFSWNFQDVRPGHVGVYWDTPYIFGHGGVRDEIVQPGRIATWRSTRVEEVSTAPWTIKVHVDDMMSASKVPLDFDVAITLQMTDPSAAPALMREFNGGPVTAFSRLVMPGLNLETLQVTNPSGEFMSYLRDKVREKHMDEFIVAHDANGKHSDASGDIEKSSAEHVNNFLKAKGVKVIVTNVALGRANPPEPVKAAMERTAEQVQLQTTQVERKIAEVARKEAEVASADADKAQQAKLGFNNAEYLEKLRLEMMVKVCGSASKDLKDGAGSRCIVNFGSGTAVPVFQVK
jgi:regulator of protease activity HflC (stomatin/prohibitin superfamily)